MTNSIPPVDAHEPPAIIDDTHRPTWDILIERYKDMRVGVLQSSVLKMMERRNQFGYAKHKTYLTPRNGRDSLADAVQEALDCSVYLMNALLEEPSELLRKFIEDSLDMSLILLENICLAWEMQNNDE